jgi:hypothetical protein
VLGFWTRWFALRKCGAKALPQAYNTSEPIDRVEIVSHDIGRGGESCQCLIVISQPTLTHRSKNPPIARRAYANVINLCIRGALPVTPPDRSQLGDEPVTASGPHLPSSLIFWYTKFMPKAISRTRKTRGRPPTGAESIHLRVLPDQYAAIDAWIAKQKEPDLTRPEAIRRLVELGLKAKK